MSGFSIFATRQSNTFNYTQFAHIFMEVVPILRRKFGRLFYQIAL
jgi:hypothetical protein